MAEPDFTNKTVYGTLGKLGVAMPAGGYIAVTDFHRWLCRDIAISDYPVPLGSVSPEGLQVFADKVTEAMHLYRDYDPVDLAFLSCTAGSQVGGPGYDAYLCGILKEAATPGRATPPPRRCSGPCGRWAQRSSPSAPLTPPT